MDPITLLSSVVVALVAAGPSYLAVRRTRKATTQAATTAASETKDVVVAKLGDLDASMGHTLTDMAGRMDNVSRRLTDMSMELGKVSRTSEDVSRRLSEVERWVVQHEASGRHM